MPPIGFELTVSAFERPQTARPLGPAIFFRIEKRKKKKEKRKKEKRKKEEKKCRRIPINSR